MRPFQINERKKPVQLERGPFDLKGYFAKMIKSPDSMYPKLQSLLDHKDAFRLHAFVELGGISKIYEWLTRFYGNNEEHQIIKWLEILNHEHFPIDTSLIGELGLGNFINKQIKQKWKTLAPLTTAIEQKWYQFAKQEKEAISKRKEGRCKKVVFPKERDQYEKQIRFKRNDKPSQLMASSSSSSNRHQSHHRDRHKNGEQSVQSILRVTHSSNIAVNGDHTDPMHSVPDHPIDDHDHHENGNEYSPYTLEYVNDPQDDVEMSNNSFTEEDEEDIDGTVPVLHFMNEKVQWYPPVAMQIEFGFGRKEVRTESVVKEEERIRDTEEGTGSECIELESSKVGSNDPRTECVEIVIKTDYPHWSDIERYRREHNIY